MSRAARPVVSSAPIKNALLVEYWLIDRIKPYENNARVIPERAVDRWRFRADEDAVGWLTPWFMVDISVGGYDWAVRGRSWHVRLTWSRGDGGVFARRRTWEFQSVPAELFQRSHGF